MKKTFLLLLILVLVTGCAEKKRLIQKTQIGTPPVRLAILPSTNQTNDILGGIVLRNVTYKRFQEQNRNYDIQDITQTDDFLISQGITDGNLLKLFTPTELCQILHVDGLLFIDIYEMGMKTLPFYHSRYIDTQYRMYNFSKLVWQKPIKIANRYVDVAGGIKAIDNLANGKYESLIENSLTSVGVQQIIKLGTATFFEHELKPEMTMVVDDLIESIPYGNKSSVEEIKRVEEILKVLDSKKKKGEKISLGDEEVVEEYEIKVNSQGVNFF